MAHRAAMNRWQEFYWLQSRHSPWGSFGPRFLDMNLLEHGGPVEVAEKTATRTVMRARLPPWCPTAVKCRSGVARARGRGAES